MQKITPFLWFDDPTKRMHLPWFMKFLRRMPSLQKIPAYLVGIGFRPEHVRIDF